MIAKIIEMNESRHTVNTIIDSSNLYMRIPNCPNCKSDTSTVGMPMQSIWEHIQDDVYTDKTVSRYKTGHRCFRCSYEEVHEVSVIRC